MIYYKLTYIEFNFLAIDCSPFEELHRPSLYLVKLKSKELCVPSYKIRVMPLGIHCTVFLLLFVTNFPSFRMIVDFFKWLTSKGQLVKNGFFERLDSAPIHHVHTTLYGLESIWTIHTHNNKYASPMSKWHCW